MIPCLKFRYFKPQNIDKIEYTGVKKIQKVNLSGCVNLSEVCFPDLKSIEWIAVSPDQINLLKKKLYDIKVSTVVLHFSERIIRELNGNDFSEVLNQDLELIKKYPEKEQNLICGYIKSCGTKKNNFLMKEVYDIVLTYILSIPELMKNCLKDKE